MSWYLGDDAGYLDWLVSHPAGYVLNTWPHVTAGYLVLHRAACRSINRDLGSERRWTVQYGKACADTRAELEAWAVERAGSPPTPCRRCLPDAKPPSVAPMTRRPLAGLVPGPMTGDPVVLRVPRLDGGPDLVIEGAQWLAELFFLRDPSATGPLSFDAATRTTPPDRFVEEDVRTLNRTMAARTAHASWADLLAAAPSPTLASLPVDADLGPLPEAVPLVAAAIEGMRAPYRGLAVVTKMLHLKRPALVPVLDSLVVDQLGVRGRGIDATIGHVRTVVTENRDALAAVTRHLEGCTGGDGGPIVRTPLRILDGLLWSTHPASVLHPELTAWETVVRIASQ